MKCSSVPRLARAQFNGTSVNIVIPRNNGARKEKMVNPIVLAVYCVATPALPSRYLWGRTSVRTLFSLLRLSSRPERRDLLYPQVGARYIVPLFASILPQKLPAVLALRELRQPEIPAWQLPLELRNL